MNPQDWLYTYRITDLVRVKDGDTIVCIIDCGFNVRKKVTVRLLDFDALETRRTNKARKQSILYSLDLDDVIAVGKQVKNELENFFAGWDFLYLKSCSLDSFGRSLGYIYKNSVCINDEIKRIQEYLIKESRGG